MDIRTIFTYGIAVLGFLLRNAIVQFKKYERTVTGLAEQEYPADLVSWHITSSDAHDNLTLLYKSREGKMKNAYLKDSSAFCRATRKTLTSKKLRVVSTIVYYLVD